MFIIVVNDDNYVDINDQVRRDELCNMFNNPIFNKQLSSKQFMQCNIVDRKQIYDLLGCQECDMDIAIANTNSNIVHRRYSGNPEVPINRVHYKKCDLLISHYSDVLLMFQFRHEIILTSCYKTFSTNACVMLNNNHQQKYPVKSYEERDAIVMPYIHKLIAKKYQKLQMKRMLKQLTFAKSCQQVIAELQDENTKLKATINTINDSIKLLSN